MARSFHEFLQNRLDVFNVIYQLTSLLSCINLITYYTPITQICAYLCESA